MTILFNKFQLVTTYPFRRGANGNPSLLKTSGMVVLSKQKRTANGIFTTFDESTTVEPSILAVAGTNFWSLPAISKSSGVFIISF